MIRRALLPLSIGLALASAPATHAGGEFVDLAVGGGRVWFAGPPGVRSLDAGTGRIRSMPRLAGAPYPLSVTVAGGAAWVASVENGYVWGTLSRIDERTGEVRVVWRRRGSSVQYVAAGAGSIWALIGTRTSYRIARFTLAGHLVRVWHFPLAARMAADGAGCWITTDRWLLRIDPAGRLHRVLRTPGEGVATGAGAVWLSRAASLRRLDERTGTLRTLATGRLGLGGFQHDVAAGDGAVWVLRHESRARTTLLRIDGQSGRTTGRASLSGNADAVVVTPRAVWVALVGAPPRGGYLVIRIDPRTLERTLARELV